MKLTAHQELALRKPYTDADAQEKAASGPDPLHIATQWLSTDVQVHKIITVNLPQTGRPYWHVSMSVNIRDIGTIYVKAMEIKMRRRLREVGYDALKGVGMPADMDKWDVGDKALHLMRSLTDGEIEMMEAIRG